MSHTYGLNWIDEEKLFEVTKSTLKNAIKQSKSSEKFKLPPDPFTLVAQAAMLDTPLSEAINFEPARALNKSISNSIGLWHQHVLGLSDIWVDTGSNGGVADIKTTQPHPKFNKPLIVEVKNRFNTIKKVDEKDTWDKLENLARFNNGIAYIFQIVPELPVRYDRPWKVSNRPEKDYVRAADGETAYELVFDVPDALEQLYVAFPLILSDVLDRSCNVDKQEAIELFYRSLPSK